jgi:hypothetical protein
MLAWGALGVWLLPSCHSGSQRRPEPCGRQASTHDLEGNKHGNAAKAIAKPRCYFRGHADRRRRSAAAPEAQTGKTLNAANLETPGAARLAELLMAISKGSAAAQRQLRLALAGSGGAEGTGRAVTRQLIRIGQAIWLDWQKIKPFLAELEVQRRAILDVVAHLIRARPSSCCGA